ncbi:hypothetical protein Patl1_15272 [Pistacia atlantica]|uniref:Uncharacterized protein n=1 Tax=Pistacia atlantica TaxID=434234 RepID=A0ACC1B8T9_9ROSI|nr:hypothetical protein Patl1_15272 [Pistacia atlantica]
MRPETSSKSMSSGVNSPPLEPTGSNSAPTLPLVTINTSSQLPYKLTSSNYPSWRATFLTILIGYDLIKYVDGTLRSRARIMQLKEDLTLIQRDDDLTLYVLNGLGSDFRDMVAPIHTRETALSFAELHDLLLGHEHYLKRMDGNSSTLVVTANSSQWKPSNPRLKNNKNRPKQNFSNKAPSKKSSVVCQIYDHPGHTAKNCVKL